MRERKISTKWLTRFNELCEYGKLNGTLTIPKSDMGHSWLRNWCFTQRTSWNRLLPEQIDKLESIGFTCKLNNHKWDEWFIMLENFKRQNGHVKLTYRSKTDYSLSIWLHNQKRRFLKGTLPDNRISRLKEIGVSWIVKEK